MMKVAINARFVQRQLEGVGHYSVQVIEHLSRANPDDEYHVILDRDYHLPWMDRPNVTRHIVYPSARHPLLWKLWFEWRLPSLLKKIKPDLFFSPDGYLSLKTKVPSVLTVHDLAFLRYPEGIRSSHLKYLEKNTPLFMDRADRILSISKFTANVINKNYPQASSKISIIANGVSETFKPLSDEEKIACRKYYTRSRPYFLYLGAIHPRKNVAQLIRAFDQYKKVAQDDMCLILAGRMAWQTEEVNRALTNAEYKDDIIHLSHLDGKVPQLVGAAEAMCYISLLEGFGLPVLEAMACEVPVITTANSAMSEICGSAAIYVDPHSVENIALGLLSITKDVSKASSMAASGVERSKDYSWSKTAARIHESLKEVCDSKIHPA